MGFEERSDFVSRRGWRVGSRAMAAARLHGLGHHAGVREALYFFPAVLYHSIVSDRNARAIPGRTATVSAGGSAQPHYWPVTQSTEARKCDWP